MTGIGEKKILRAFEYHCAGCGRPVSFERSVLLLTSEEAGHHGAFCSVFFRSPARTPATTLYISHISGTTPQINAQRCPPDVHDL